MGRETIAALAKDSDLDLAGRRRRTPARSIWTCWAAVA